MYFTIDFTGVANKYRTCPEKDFTIVLLFTERKDTMKRRKAPNRAAYNLCVFPV